MDMEKTKTTHGICVPLLALGLLLIVLQTWDTGYMDARAAVPKQTPKAKPAGDTLRIDSPAPGGTPLHTSTSHDKRFTVAAYPGPVAAPGRSDDRPVPFILGDNRTGKELQRRQVEHRLIDVTYVEWGEDSVQVVGGGVPIQWRLPR